MSHRGDLEDVSSQSEWSGDEEHDTGEVSSQERTPEGHAAPRRVSTDSSSSSSERSSSSSSSTSTLVEAPIKQRAVARDEVATQTEVRGRRRRNRTRKQRREARLRREAASREHKTPPKNPETHKRQQSSSRRRQPSPQRSRTYSVPSRQLNEPSKQDSSKNRQARPTEKPVLRRTDKSPPKKTKTMKVSLSAKGRSVEARDNIRLRDSSGSSCPVPGCRTKSRKLKRHAYEVHLPSVFRDVTFPRAEIDDNFQQIRGDALLTLTHWLMDDNASVFDLVYYVNSKKLVPKHTEILKRQIIQYQLFSYAMKWRQPDKFSLNPVNSPAVLIH